MNRSTIFLDLLEKRRSIRRYEARAVETAKIDILLECALRSPASRSLNPWEFIVVTDPATGVALSQAKPHGAGFLANAPLIIVVLADPNQSDVWIEDASIAAYGLHLAATDLGLGSCWVQIRLREHDQTQTAEARVRDILSIPPNRNVLAMVGIGYPAEQKAGHAKTSLLDHKIFWERYGNGKDPS